MRSRAKQRVCGLIAGLVGVAGVSALVFAAPLAAAAATTPPTAPPVVTPVPTLKGSVVPGSTAAPVVTAPARTNPPQSAAQSAPKAVTPNATAAPRTTAAPATTAPPATVTTAAAPTTQAEVAPSTAAAAVTTAAARATASVGDSSASHRNSRIAWALAVMGALVGGLTVWFWFATRPVPVGMGGLAEMSTTRWWRSDGRKRDEMLARSRHGLAPIDDSLLVVAAPAVPAASAVSDPAVPVDDLPAWARDPDPLHGGSPVAPDPAQLWADVIVEPSVAGAADVTGPVPVTPAAASPAPIDPPAPLEPAGTAAVAGVPVAPAGWAPPVAVDEPAAQQLAVDEPTADERVAELVDDAASAAEHG